MDQAVTRRLLTAMARVQSMAGQSTLGLRWTKWHSDRVFSENLGFLLSVQFHQYLFLTHMPQTLHNLATDSVVHFSYTCSIKLTTRSKAQNGDVLEYRSIHFYPYTDSGSSKSLNSKQGSSLTAKQPKIINSILLLSHVQFYLLFILELLESSDIATQYYLFSLSNNTAKVQSLQKQTSLFHTLTL